MMKEQYAQTKIDRYPRPIAPPRPRLKLALNRVRRVFAPSSTYKVHFVYFIPTDREPVATLRIQQVAAHLRAWYRWVMSGKTFSWYFHAIRTNHPQLYYSTHDTGGDYSQWFWINTLQELSDQLGGGFYQQFDDWCVYIDADIGEGQSAGGTSGGYTSGVCVLPSRDVQAIMGLDPEWTICRGIGGCGHELGHTFGLPHPPPPPDPAWVESIMGIGYMSYSNANLSQPAIDQLNANPFFAPRLRTPAPEQVCPFNDGLDRVRPTPRPRPTPTPR